MVTIEDIALELTKPPKHLADWEFPFSETLKTYYSLFKDTSNKGFSNAGLVLQNSTAVYVHRINYLWNETALIRNIILDCKKEEEKNKVKRKKDKNSNISLEDFGVINFAEVIDKNIDIKKDNAMQESVKSKTRCFTQLEKGIAQHVPIDIYDVNGEVIGKKYDFRCNQNMSINGVLIDEFAPEDFDSNIDDSFRENSIGTAHDNSDKNLSTDEEESERNDSLEETSDLIGSLDSSQNLSSSNDSISDMTNGSVTDNQHDQSSNDSANESQCTSHNDTNLPSNTVDSITLSNSNTDAQSSSNNIGTNVHDDNDQLDSTAKSKDSQERTLPMDSATLLKDVNENTELSKSPSQVTHMLQADPCTCLTYIREHNPLEYVHVMNETPDLLGFQLNVVESCDSQENTTQLSFTENEEMVESSPSSPAANLTSNSSKSTPKNQSRQKCTPKTLQKGRIGKKFLGKEHAAKKKLNKLQKKNLKRILRKLMSSEKDRLSMFHKNTNTCTKYIQEYDPLEYDHMTDAASNFLGFQLHVDGESHEACDSVHDDTRNNMMMTSADLDDDDMSSLYYSPVTVPFSPEQHENSCDSWLQPENTSNLLPKNIEEWHEFLQPKLRDAERRSKFSIHQYRSQIIECLRTNVQCQVNFDNVIPMEEAGEVARYFLASLDLASRQKVTLIKNTDLEHTIQIALCENDAQYFHDDQEDSHD